MRKTALLFAFIATIMCQVTCYAAAPSRVYNYASGATISSSQVNTNETALYTYLQNGVDSIAVGAVSDINVIAGAGIQYSKLNLAGQIVNADINASAAIADSKLAQITTASKVSTSSLTGDFTLTSFHGGTGASATTFFRGDNTWATPPAQNFTHLILYTVSQDFTVPAGVYVVFVTALGGGGGGGSGIDGTSNSAAGGLHSTISARMLIMVTPASVYSITVGSGGNGGTSGNAGSTGGTSQWVSSTWSSSGGAGGAGHGNGGCGGNANNGCPGESNLLYGGVGGIQGYYNGAPSYNGADATNYGAGGGGGAASPNANTGGKGSQGFVIVEW